MKTTLQIFLVGVILHLAGPLFSQALEKKVLFTYEKGKPPSPSYIFTNFYNHKNGIVARTGNKYYFFGPGFELEKEVTTTTNWDIKGFYGTSVFGKMVATPHTAYNVVIEKALMGKMAGAKINRINISIVQREGTYKDIVIEPTGLLRSSDVVYATEKGLYCLLLEQDKKAMKYLILWGRPDGSYSYIPTEEVPDEYETEMLHMRQDFYLKELFYNAKSNSMVFYSLYAEDEDRIYINDNFIRDLTAVTLRTTEISLETGKVLAGKQWGLVRPFALYGIYLPVITFDYQSNSFLVSGLYNSRAGKKGRMDADGHFIIVFNYFSNSITSSDFQTFDGMKAKFKLEIPSIARPNVVGNSPFEVLTFKSEFHGVDRNTKEVAFSYKVNDGLGYQGTRQVQYSLNGELTCIKEKRESGPYELPKSFKYLMNKSEGHFINKQDQLMEIYKDKKVNYMLSDPEQGVNPVFITIDEDQSAVVAYW